jgi:hypothetical protein
MFVLLHGWELGHEWWFHHSLCIILMVLCSIIKLNIIWQQSPSHSSSSEPKSIDPQQTESGIAGLRLDRSGTLSSSLLNVVLGNSVAGGRSESQKQRSSPRRGSVVTETDSTGPSPLLDPSPLKRCSSKNSNRGSKKALLFLYMMCPFLLDLCAIPHGFCTIFFWL